MKYTLRNFGIVEYAEIEVSGLTILTGLNDIGKSFISKALFSIINTINSADSFASNSKYQVVMGMTQDIYQKHRQIVPFTKIRQSKFNTTQIHNLLVNYIYKKDNSSITKDEVIDIIRKYVDSVVKDIEDEKSVNLAGESLVIENIKRIHLLKESIINEIFHEKSIEDTYKQFFDFEVIQKIFQNQVNQISTDKPAAIQLHDGATLVLDIVISDNKTQKFLVHNPILLKDATIIETPVVIQLADFITNSLAFGFTNERLDIPFSYIDLSQKMKTASFAAIPNNLLKIHKSISSVIGGELKNSKEDGVLMYVKENGDVVKTFNIATGIKSFGLLQLIINAGIVHEKSLLIIDEPEVHLHPKWELEYAKIIIALCRCNIPIVISTHSPYLIEALYKISKSEDLLGITNFYLGEKSDLNATNFKNVNNDLNLIFEKLAQPMRDLSKY